MMPTLPEWNRPPICSGRVWLTFRPSNFVPNDDPPMAYYSSAENQLVLYNDEADVTLRQTLFHETSHQYLDRYTDWPDRQRATYAAMVTCMDKALGDIVGALDKNDYPAGNTLIFYKENEWQPVRRHHVWRIIRHERKTSYFCTWTVAFRRSTHSIRSHG